jgi:hypothetical protein
MPRKSLSDILHGSDRESISRAWGETKAAEDFARLPPGEYVARIVGGELSTSKSKGTPSYKLTFRVLEGDFTGRRFWHDVYLTPAALPMAKRDLGKLGVTALEQLERPLPPGIRCRVKLALRRDDDGSDFNKLKTFAVVGIDEPETDAFAPRPDPAGNGSGAIPPIVATGAADGGEDSPEPPQDSVGGGNVPF